MKKLLSLLLATVSFTAIAGDWKSQSFINPTVVSLAVSNNFGVTNLDYINQNALQGAGATPTNYTGVWYTSSPPVYVSSVLQPGTLIVVTNAALVNNTNAGYSVATNVTLNLLGDVSLGPDQASSDQQGLPGAAGPTNIAGIISIRSQGNTLFTSGTAGGGSNTVTLIFTPIGDPTLGEPTDGAVSGGGAANNIQLTYTNQAGVIAPTIYQFPVPRWKVAECKALRLRSITPGPSTNAIWIQCVTFSRWIP